MFQYESDVNFFVGSGHDTWPSSRSRQGGRKRFLVKGVKFVLERVYPVYPKAWEVYPRMRDLSTAERYGLNINPIRNKLKHFQPV